MAYSEVWSNDYSEWVDVLEDLEIGSDNTFQKNGTKNENLPDKLPDDKLSLSENIGEFFPKHVEDKQISVVSSFEMNLERHENVIPKPYFPFPDKNQERTDLENQNSEIFDRKIWEDAVEGFEILSKDVFAENHCEKETNDGTLSRDEMISSKNIGDISIIEEENRTKHSGERSLEIILSEQNANVIPKLISVLSGEDLEKTVLLDLCQRIRGNTKWVMEYNKLRRQKPKITLTELTDSNRGKVNKNGSTFFFGIMACNILCFALGLSIGLWNRNLVQTLAIFEFDLDSVLY